MTDHDLIELFNERIALMTIDGEQSEQLATKHAYFMVRKLVGGADNVPAVIRDAMREAMRV